MRHYTILLVDYEPRSIERTRRPLVDAGFTVETATDGLAALDAFAQLKPDLVLIEAMLPKKHGFEVCHELKKTPQGKRTPILITTAVYKGRKYRTQALHIHGCDEYVEKPIADEQLLGLVRRFLETSGTGPGPQGPLEPTDVAEPEPRPGPHRDRDVIELADDSLQDTPPAETSSLPSPSRLAAPPPFETESHVASHAPAPGRAPSRIESAVKVPWRTGTSAVVGDLTEDEIMARLDEILPSDSFNGPVAIPETSHPLTTSAVEAESRPVAPPTPSVSVAEEPSTDTDDLEEVAEGLFETRFASVPPEIVLEPIPLEPSVPADATDLEAPPAFDHRDDTRSDVVPFDARRSKKRKKNHGRPSAAPESSHPAPARPAATHVVAPLRAFEPAPGPSPIAARATVEPFREPPVVDPVSPFPGAERSAPRRGSPLWIWAAATAVVVGGVYFAFFRATPTGASTPEAGLSDATPATPAEVAIGEPAVAAVLPAPSPASERTAAPSEPAASRTETRPPANAASAAKQTGSPVATAPTAPKPVPEPTVVSPKPAAVAPSPKPPSPSTASRPAAPAPENASDMAGLGVEPVPVQIATPSQTTTKRSVQTGDLVPLSEVDYPPVAVIRTAPQYTPRARLSRQQGTVVLNLLVDESGRVADVQILKAIAGSDLDESAARTARGWTFKPAVKDGVSVKVWKAEQVVFRP